MSDLDPRWGDPSPRHDPRLLAGFRPRPTDVLIATAPKAGTTWMQQILHQLRSGGDEEFATIFSVVPWLELPIPGRSPEQTLAGYEALPEPRVFKTHCTREQLPGLEQVKVVVVFRDPGDCCVSFFHHLHDMTEASRARMQVELPASFDAHVEAWLERRAWYRNVETWWPERGRENVLLLRFEELKRDLAGCMDRIVDFLGWQVAPAARARAAELSGFAWMKAHQPKFATVVPGEEPDFEPHGFIRQGKVGEARARLTPPQLERILAEARACLEPECLAYLELT